MPLFNVKMAAGGVLEQKRERVELTIDEYPRENRASGGRLYIDKFGPGCGFQGTEEK